MSVELPPRRVQRGISLTPLVDVIFLLLIFFMLTSQIAPFSLISFAGTKAENKQVKQLAVPRETPTELASLGTLITVLKGGISVNGRRTAHADIDRAMAEMRKNGISAAIISPRSTASVQDLITVLEAVKRASFKSITIRKSG
ncbi:MAG: biopolymer transporter ExbD [Spirochaetales bacterium]|nr:biopolymer transporter ExbD [Spirochaetales bacterium]